MDIMRPHPWHSMTQLPTVLGRYCRTVSACDYAPGCSRVIVSSSCTNCLFSAGGSPDCRCGHRLSIGVVGVAALHVQQLAVSDGDERSFQYVQICSVVWEDWEVPPPAAPRSPKCFSMFPPHSRIAQTLSRGGLMELQHELQDAASISPSSHFAKVLPCLSMFFPLPFLWGASLTIGGAGGRSAEAKWLDSKYGAAAVTKRFLHLSRPKLTIYHEQNGHAINKSFQISTFEILCFPWVDAFARRTCDIQAWWEPFKSLALIGSNLKLMIS